MNPHGKAREYWLKFAEAYGDEDQIFDEKSDYHQKQIHVIEFEAYSKAVKALKVAQKENEKLLKFKEEMWKLGQAMPPNAISMMIQRELGKL